MTKTLTVTLFLPFARLVTSRNCPGLTGQVLDEVCALRSSGDRASGIFPDIPRFLMHASGMTAPERSVLSPAAGTPVEHDPEHGHSRQSGLKSGRADDKPAKVFFQSSVPGGHENHFDELMAIMEASKAGPTPSSCKASAVQD